MSPYWTAFQATVAGVALTVLVLLGDAKASWIAFSLAAFAALLVVGLNTNYARALARAPRSERRARGDRVLAMTSALVFLPATAFALAGTQTRYVHADSQALAGSSIREFVAITAAIAVVMVFLSSSTDWWAIRAWRDGIVAPPPWMRERRGTWVNVTRWWLHHRIVATITFFAALWTTIGLGWFELAKHFSTSAWAYYLLGLISPAALPLFFIGRYVAGLGPAIGIAWGNLEIALGDVVSWRDHGERIEGIVYDVSIDRGYRIVERDGSSRTLRLSDLRSTHGLDVDERKPPTWAQDAVRTSDIDGVADYLAPRTRSSGRWFVF